MFFFKVISGFNIGILIIRNFDELINYFKDLLEIKTFENKNDNKNDMFYG